MLRSSIALAAARFRRATERFTPTAERALPRWVGVE